MARWPVIRRVPAFRWMPRIVAGVRVIVPSTRPAKTIAAPSVVVAPISPRPNPQENSIVEISWPVISRRSTAIGRIAIVAIRTRGRRAERDRHLCSSLRKLDGRHK